MKKYKVHLIIEEDDQECVDESRVMKECGTLREADATGFIPQKCAGCSTLSTKNKGLVIVLGKPYCGLCAWKAVNTNARRI